MRGANRVRSWPADHSPSRRPCWRGSRWQRPRTPGTRRSRVSRSPCAHTGSTTARSTRSPGRRPCARRRPSSGARGSSPTAAPGRRRAARSGRSARRSSAGGRCAAACSAGTSRCCSSCSRAAASSCPSTASSTGPPSARCAATSARSGSRSTAIAGPVTLRTLGRGTPGVRPVRPAPAPAASVRTMLTNWAIAYRLDPALVRALAWMESGFQPGLVSSAGARGVLQVLPSTRSYVQSVLIGYKVPSSTSGQHPHRRRVPAPPAAGVQRQPDARAGRLVPGPLLGAQARPARRHAAVRPERPSAAARAAFSGGWTGCGGGFESTRTAAASRIAIADRALARQAARQAGERAARRARARGRTRKWCARAPGQRERDEPELHEQHLPVAARPEVGEVRQPQDAQVDPGREQQRRSARSRGARSAGTRCRRSAGSSGQTTNASCTSPPTQSAAAREVHPVGELREPRRAGVGGRVAREREARRRTRARAGTPARAAASRSVSQARKSSAATSAKPSVIATNASPKRVFARAARGRRRGSRRTGAGARPRRGAGRRAIPTSSAPTTPTPSEPVEAPLAPPSAAARAATSSRKPSPPASSASARK